MFQVDGRIVQETRMDCKDYTRLMINACTFNSVILLTNGEDKGLALKTTQLQQRCTIQTGADIHPMLQPMPIQTVHPVAMQPYTAPVYSFMVSTPPVTHIFTWISTHISTQRNGRLRWLTHSGQFIHKVVSH